MKINVSTILGAAGVSLVLIIAACSGGSSGGGLPPDDAGFSDVVDASMAPAVDAGDAGPNGAPSDVYPAFRPPVPQILNSHGPVVAAPIIVPVFFSGDPEMASMTTFLTQFTSSPALGQMVGEYGVGAATLSAAVLVTDPAPAMVEDADIGAMLVSLVDGVDGGAPAAPPATADTIYVLFYPVATTINLSGRTSCVAFAGYHGRVKTKGPNATYAVIPTCAAAMLAARRTATVTHEIAEAATDPSSQIGFGVVDPLDDIWAVFGGGGEVGDMGIAAAGDPTMLFDGITSPIQRMWSNAAAAAHKNPLVPAKKNAPYYVAVPVMPDVVPASYNGIMNMVRGVTVGAGKSKAIDLQLWSDGPTGGPWSVSANELAIQAGMSGTLAFAFDRTSGQNGEILHMTVTVKKANAVGASSFLVVSTIGAVQYGWVGTVSQ